MTIPAGRKQSAAKTTTRTRKTTPAAPTPAKAARSTTKAAKTAPAPPKTTTKAGAVETAVGRLVDGMRRDKLLTIAGHVQAAMCVAAARGLDQAVESDNQYGIRQSIVSLREMVADLQAIHRASTVQGDAVDDLLAAISGPPVTS